jgi:N-acetylneuraminate synthase
MDLASENEDYRLTSIFETQRVIEITKMLKTFFPKCKRPLIVANIGGFSMDAPFNQIKIENCYEIFSKSLKQLDLSGVELIPQTMAPFPWHFGGQRFQNLFVRIEEIIEVCKKLKLRMCFDISHSKLTCNYLGYDFYRFAEIIAPYTAHIHIGDARALNGEGLQIGDGEIDFNILNKILAEGCPQASFIPEIWQGHKNNGDGFWIALERLNGKI